MENSINFLPILARFGITLSWNMVWWVVGVVCLIYIVYTIILLYHWERYGIKTVRTFLVELIYFSVSAVIMMLMTASALTIASYAF